jgi:NHL repeat
MSLITLQFNGYCIAIDNSDNVCIADTFNNRVQVFALDLD